MRDAAEIVNEVAAEIPLVPPSDPTTQDADVVLPRGFTLDKHGLRYWPPATKKDAPPPPPVQVAGAFKIVSEVCDDTGGGWGLLLDWNDREGRPHRWAMARRLLHLDGGGIAAELADGGLGCGVSRTAHDLLKQFLAEVQSTHRTRCVARAGWHTIDAAPCFVLADGSCITPDKDGIGPVLQSDSTIALTAFAEAGTLEEWRREIAAYAPGNDRLVLALSAAFTGPLLDMMSAHSGGVHLVGKSQSGKTTLLRSAATVWGRGDETGQVRNWRSTANGLEAIAAECCDSFLTLDEIGQADAREAAETAYMIANQAGKQRASRTGGARRRQTWRVWFLSTGEIGLAAKLAEIGRRAMAGQSVRLLDVPADAGGGLGVFQALHDKPDAAALADHLRQASRCHYGTAGRAFLGVLVGQSADAEARANLRAWLQQQVDAFLTAHLPPKADGQVRSAAARFALIASAGELATEYRILPWPAGEAARGVGACFNAWLAARGGAGAAEDDQATAAVRAFIALHGSARFATIHSAEGVDNPVDERVVNRAGWRRWTGEGWEYLILPSAWSGEVCRGLDPKAAADALRERGFLLGGEDRHRAAAIRVPGHGVLRLYRIAPAILAGDDPAEG